MVGHLRAQTPAAFAEQYIVESIWKGRFAPGTILPAERELSELIGVTRTTLREVLQRLARDGWLTIRHGVPTKVNHYWDTAGLNILDTLACLDDSGELDLVWQLLDARTAMGGIFLRKAIRANPEKVIELLKQSEKLSDDAISYINYDWTFLHGITRATGNAVYTLLLNGFKTLYKRVGRYYFSKPAARRLASDFYRKMIPLVEENQVEAALSAFHDYCKDGGEFYKSLRQDMPLLMDLEDID
ncbi:MAG: fatty acid metabolism transcriptional regulator FadR [Gammaproteobacteria bacterium CG22_combo_CG10-13_8_21_14_all_40_8]|nr:MAG: fatty acid metabolism transcriptional regulator FadR [Gammaproteobacteria bacterium CG22_combo_CG10-13_8_21_14_all_40_8]